MPDRAQAGDRDLLQRFDQRGGELIEVRQRVLRLGDEVDLAQPDRVQHVLPRREDRRQVRPDVRDRRDELGDRGRQRARGDDHEHDEDHHDQRVHDDRGQGPRQARVEVDEAADDRADDERQEPRQEERQEDVAEEEERLADQPDDDEEERDDAEHEERADQPAFARPAPVRNMTVSADPSSCRTSSIVASAIGRMRSAPASRIASTSLGVGEELEVSLARRRRSGR